MNIDDVEDKTRRNLMAYCTAILASTLLDISISQNVLGIAVKTDAPAWVVLLCANVALMYLFVRFGLSPKVAEARAQWSMDHRRKVGGIQLKFVSQELRAALTYRAPPKGLRITGNKVPPSHTIIVTNPEPQIEWFDRGRGIFLGQWARSVNNTPVGACYEDPVAQPVYFQLTRRRQLIYEGQLFLARFRLDWPSLELGFPVLMTFAAATCLAWKGYLAYPCFGLLGKLICS